MILTPLVRRDSFTPTLFSVVALITLSLLSGTITSCASHERGSTQIPLEWTDPEMAIEMAVSEAGRTWDRPGLRYLRDNAVRVRNAHALASAPVGSFNDDPEDFYPWILERIVQYDFPTREAVRHLEAQIGVAIGDPSSEIARKLRDIAAGKDPARPIPRGGEFAYWDYLIWPATFSRNNDLQDELMYRSFSEVVYSYRIKKRNGELEGSKDFATYLAESEFFPKWFGGIPGTD